MRRLGGMARLAGAFKRSLALACVVALALSFSGLSLSACGSSGGAGSGPTYWRANIQGASALYMSVVPGGGAVSGWAKYGDGSFSHYTGTQNSDGTYTISAYGGGTLAIDGNKLTVTSGEGHPIYYQSIGKSEYTAGGGPG